MSAAWVVDRRVYGGRGSEALRSSHLDARGSDLQDSRNTSGAVHWKPEIDINGNPKSLSGVH